MRRYPVKKNHSDFAVSEILRYRQTNGHPVTLFIFIFQGSKMGRHDINSGRGFTGNDQKISKRFVIEFSIFG